MSTILSCIRTVLCYFIIYVYVLTIYKFCCSNFFYQRIPVSSQCLYTYRDGEKCPRIKVDVHYGGIMCYSTFKKLNVYVQYTKTYMKKYYCLYSKMRQCASKKHFAIVSSLTIFKNEKNNMKQQYFREKKSNEEHICFRNTVKYLYYYSKTYRIEHHVCICFFFGACAKFYSFNGILIQDDDVLKGCLKVIKRHTHTRDLY